MTSSVLAGSSNVNEWDFAVIAIHFVITISLGLWSSFRKTDSSSSTSSASSYFLAGRDMTWPLVGLSLYMSNIGSTSFIGVAGSASASGVAILCYELCGLFGIILLGYMFIPVYVSSGVYTMPEYLKKRFGGSRLQLYLAVQSLILFVFTKLSAEIFGGTLIIQLTLGWDRYLSIVGLLITTTLYTILGGLSAVIYTDALQGVVVIIGSIILAVIGMTSIGGYESMEHNYMHAIAKDTLLSNTTCGLADPYAFKMMRPLDDPNLPWLGITFGAFILSGWYFCTDQVLVQRILAAKDLTHAKAGTALAAILKVLPLFLMVWPGMISRTLYVDEVACGTPEACKSICDNESGCSNVAYFLLILNSMPVVIRGLMLAAMLAALMSSLTSIFNSASTLFTIDVWIKMRPKAGNREQMIVSRLFVLVFVVIGIVWIPILDLAEGGQIFNYLQGINSYLAPPVFACYLMAVSWERMNEKGAFWGLMVSLPIGVARMIWSFVESAPPCGTPDTRSFLIKDFHFLHFSIFLFLLTVAVSVVVSYATKPIPREQLKGLTIWTLRSKEEIAEITKQHEAYVKRVAEEDAAAAAVKSEMTTFEEEVKPKKDWKKILLSALCGAEDEAPEKQLDEKSKELLELQMTVTASRENPKWQPFVDAFSVGGAAAGIFVWTFFN